MNARLGLLAALALVGSSCTMTADAFCTRKSPCPNDVPSTQAQIDQCKASLQAQASAPCYADVLAYNNCLLDNVVCGGNGSTDANLSNVKATNNCINQLAGAQSCCTKNPSSTVCG